MTGPAGFRRNGSDFGSAQAASSVAFLEYLVCSMCTTPLNGSVDGRQPQFCLTSCGHVLCENHDHRQGSCAHCRRTDVQLYPLNDPSRIPPRLLQRFQPTERHAHAAQSALENLTLTLLARWHKQRIQDLERTMDEAALSIEAVKASDSDLRKQNEDLSRQLSEARAQNSSLQQRLSTLSEKLARSSTQGQRLMGPPPMPVSRQRAMGSAQPEGFVSGHSAFKQADTMDGEYIDEMVPPLKRPRTDTNG